VSGRSPSSQLAGVSELVGAPEGASWRDGWGGRGRWKLEAASSSSPIYRLAGLSNGLPLSACELYHPALPDPRLIGAVLVPGSGGAEAIRALGEREVLSVVVEGAAALPATGARAALVFMVEAEIASTSMDPYFAFQENKWVRVEDHERCDFLGEDHKVCSWCVLTACMLSFFLVTASTSSAIKG